MGITKAIEEKIAVAKSVTGNEKYNKIGNEVTA